MLRHMIFVLVLVGAAFAGGAAINGPGLAWLQHNLIGGPTIIVDGSTPTGSDPARASKRFPSANALPLNINFAAKTAQTAPQPTPAPVVEAPQPAGMPPATGNAADLALMTATAPVSAPALEPPAAANDAPMPPLDLPTEAAAPRPATSSMKSDPVAHLASTAGALDPASAPASPGATRDWTAIRQRLKALGVTRYTIDAETTGRVRFSCVIPVDGLRAVGHHFEAEGDDEYQAVEATIRRVTLWRATEPTRTDP